MFHCPFPCCHCGYRGCQEPFRLALDQPLPYPPLPMAPEHAWREQCLTGVLSKHWPRAVTSLLAKTHGHCRFSPREETGGTTDYKPKQEKYLGRTHKQAKKGPITYNHQPTWHASQGMTMLADGPQQCVARIKLSRAYETASG